MFDNEEHYIDDPLDVVNAEPDFSGIGLPPKFKFGGQKQLTEEQFAKLRETVDTLLCNAVLYAEEVASGSELDKLIIEHIVEPFIEPLINGRL